jgi:hypothetical protein
MMKKSTLSILLAVSSLILATLACNWPGSKTVPTDSSAPTPNMTMTALFNIITPQASQTSALVLPTTTSAQSQATPAPTNTSAAPTALPTVAAVFPTNTPTSAATATAVPRAASSVKAPYLSKAPTLDGVWDEWDTKAYPAKFIVYGKDKIDGDQDLEGSYRIGWDSTYLYLAVKVIDDKYAQNASGQDLYKGDSIELLLDANLWGDYYSQQLSSDDFQLVISPGKPDPDDPKEAYLYFPSGSAGTRSDVKIAAVGGDGLYRVEAAIPWSMFGINPSVGQQFGFAVSISDNDNDDKNEQQSMASMDALRSLVDPTTWAVLTLGD